MMMIRVLWQRVERNNEFSPTILNEPIPVKGKLGIFKLDKLTEYKNNRSQLDAKLLSQSCSFP